MTYAGFFKRTAAYIIDTVIYGIISYAIAFTLGMLLALTTSANPDGLGFSAISTLITLGCYLTYYVGTESSAWQATIGKKLFGLRVTDENGQRISFWRSLGRNVSMLVSTLTLCIGYLMCFWTEKKQCLHDKMASCLVIDDTPDQKQGCVIGVLVCLLIFPFIFGILAAIALPQYTRALERARMSEAVMTLQDAARARQLSKDARASRWDQLEVSFNCEVQSDPRVCVGNNFTYTLSPRAITAQRNDQTHSYVLSIDSNGKLSCEGKSDWTRSLCNYVAR